MPKFTEQELAHLQSKLLDVGKRMFSELGLKKTSIDDIVQACGIAKGSFYRFYESKEELFFAILEREESDIRSRLMEELTHAAESAEQTVRSMLEFSLLRVEANPFLRGLYERREMELLLRKLPAEKLIRHQEQDVEATLEWIVNSQKAGVLAPINPLIIIGVLRAFMMLPFHKQEIGEAEYEGVMRIYIDSLARTLTSSQAKEGAQP